MIFTIVSLSILAFVAWFITRCGWPEKAPLKPCK